MSPGVTDHHQVMADWWCPCPNGTEPFEVWKARTDAKSQESRENKRRKEKRHNSYGNCNYNNQLQSQQQQQHLLYLVQLLLQQ